ncbi:hypothetical protein Osc7112_1640 [Oscillatoria nigro-viridis PCC 7112]|uniref:Uncharacterized protein n=1 Tax=Phormidium nigroviride PCC 7112 TaxID=179408 RepID=K9VF53_9CYAN|nr:hypothetical protein [Oscillatoria nigro-viridis]AFZ06139.1 hypothetical protein Osc7112_1640 [Oscillatoria nigro-viridis PCC 7112]
MLPETVQLQIPFQVLLDAIASLQLEEKRRLWQILNEEITQAETNQPSQVLIQNNNGSDYQPTGEILTATEIRDRYPREWVLIADTESDDLWNVIRGEVLAHSPEREEIDRALTKFKDIRSISIEYTGPIPDDYSAIS